MLRMILAGAAAVTIGTIGGLTLVAAMPARDGAQTVHMASTPITGIVDPGPKKADAAPAAPKRTAEAATPPPAAPSPKARSAPEAAPAAATSDKPEIRFDGDRVSVRFGKFKIDF